MEQIITKTLVSSVKCIMLWQCDTIYCAIDVMYNWWWNAVTRLRNIILQTSQFKNTKQITLLSQTGVPEVQLCQKHNNFFTIVIHSITPKLTIPSCIIQITIEFPSVKYFFCNFNVTLISLHHCIFILFILLIIIYKEIHQQKRSINMCTSLLYVTV